MTLAPKLSVVPNPHADQSAIAALEAAGDQEFPNARITVEDRRLVRQLIALFEEGMSAELLMHFCCGIEAAAQRKRADERSLRR